MTVLAFDMDEVIFPFAKSYALWRKREGMESFQERDLTSYDFAKVLRDDNADGEHTSAFIADPLTLGVGPVRGSRGGLVELVRKHDIVVVTNRYETQSVGTLAWMDRWFPGVAARVIFARPRRGVEGKSKGLICSEIGAELLIDDSPEHIAGLSETPGLLFGDYPWQHSFDEALPRVRNWAELLVVLGGSS